MKSPMVTNADYVTDKGGYTELMVLMSAAGYYIGTLYNDPAGFQEPGSRDSGYYETREEAEASLRVMTALGDETAAMVLRDSPETR